MRTAAEAVVHNKLRAGLTSLGILFGVASVIAMLAIGRGAKQEILSQMQLLGSNNIVIAPLVEQKEGAAQEEEQSGKKEVKRYTPGLNYHDVEAIQRMVPGVDVASAEIVMNTTITREGRSRSGKVVGVDTTYFRLTNEALSQGSFFSPSQIERGRPVAIIGYGVRTRFFTTEEPIGRAIKVGDSWLTVIGVLKDRRVSNETAQRLGIRDPNMDVYVPVRTMLLRYRDRAQLSKKDILFQFLSEAVIISVAGGLAGIITGGLLSFGIERFADIQTLVSYISIAVAFGVSFTVGLVFGIVPAYRAARADPVVSLRYE